MESEQYTRHTEQWHVMHNCLSSISTPGTFHVEMDGVDVTGQMQVPDTNWALTTISKSGVQLTAGQHVMRVVADANAGNGYTGDFDSFSFVLNAAGGGGAASASVIQWMVTDQLGTPRMIADQSGSLEGIKRHDYLPFGEEMMVGCGGRSPQQGYNGNVDGNRKRWAQLERDDETGLDYAQARYYASAQGRFTSVDPLMASGRTGDPQAWNRYTYAYNNPLIVTDPTGLFGDFYNLDGKRLGTDGKNDGRFYVVTDKDQAKAIEQTNKKGGSTDVSNVGSAVEIGGVAVRDGIGAAVAASNQPTTDDKQGGFHEEGLTFGTTASGSQIPVPAVPGAYSDVTVQGGTATVDPTHAANPALAATLTSIDGTAHVHPAGTVTTTDSPAPTASGTIVMGGPPIKQHTAFFVQPASDVDKKAFPVYAQQGYGSIHIVAGAGSKRVEIYQVHNGASVLRATMKLDVFLRIGK